MEKFYVFVIMVIYVNGHTKPFFVTGDQNPSTLSENPNKYSELSTLSEKGSNEADKSQINEMSRSTANNSPPQIKSEIPINFKLQKEKRCQKLTSFVQRPLLQQPQLELPLSSSKGSYLPYTLQPFLMEEHTKQLNSMMDAQKKLIQLQHAINT
ncbi:uncharacterized protein LOC126894862 [Daktulosphaira vitifoliae]|uniref:uncharacterized protein LOC126894862 n=1 Tax=Daktulosphaira vitifoliae TaxID=58002 RepID=UPI0021AA14BA|nr:uncharacterized protein LOC126894862 [Daktulosphaira vitifoliae]